MCQLSTAVQQQMVLKIGIEIESWILLTRNVNNELNSRKKDLSQSTSCPKATFKGLSCKSTCGQQGALCNSISNKKGRLTWCSQLEVGAAMPSGTRPCPSSPRCAGPSTADAPGLTCPRCATGSSSGTHQDPSLIWPPRDTTPQGTLGGKARDWTVTL